MSMELSGYTPFPKVVKSVNNKAPEENGSVKLTAEDVEAATKVDFDDHDKKVATDIELGHVKVDNYTVFVDSDGVISSPQIPGPQGIQGIQGEMGDSFTISADYPTIAAMEAAFSTDGLPKGAFVIINSNNPDTDQDNGKVYIKSESEYRLQQVMRGLKGQTGLQGLQGIQGPQGIRGLKGDTPTIEEASKTTKGVVQVGSGLVVSSGVVSVEQILRSDISPNTPIADLTIGVTESSSPIDFANTTYIEFIKVVNETLGYTIPNNIVPFRFYFKNIKRSGTAVRQELTVTSNYTFNLGTEFFKLVRESDAVTGVWQKWYVDLTIIYGTLNPNNNVIGTRGCLYFEYPTGLLYRKTTGTAAGTSDGWISTNEITTATVPKGASFNPNVFESKVTKQGMFTRLEMKFIHPSTPTTSNGTTVTIGVIPSGFRPTGQPVFLKVEDNGGGSAQRNDIRIDTNGNIRWTPRVNTGNFTIAFSVVY